MLKDSDLFRLVLDEVEKTLSLVDLEIARGFAELVPDAQARDEIFDLIKQEYELSVAMVLKCDRPGRTASSASPTTAAAWPSACRLLNQVSRQQIELIRRFRATAADGAEALGRLRAPAGLDQLHGQRLGWTG